MGRAVETRAKQVDGGCPNVYRIRDLTVQFLVFIIHTFVFLGRYTLRKKPEATLIKMEPILDILRASIWTGKLSDEKPVSVMLVAEQESAKTEALKYFRGTSTLAYLSDVTSKGLSPYKKEIMAGRLRHIVLLDLVRILAHGRGVSERTIQTLASLMEEGESANSDAGGKEEWGADFPKIGALMGITPSFFKSKRGKWRQTGFMTRFVPVTFKYSDSTVKLIHNAISSGIGTPEPHPISFSNVNPGGIYVPLKEEHAAVLRQRSRELGDKMKTYGFRYQRILRALVKAHAARQKHGTVQMADVNKVIEWSEFFTDKEVVL